MIAEAKAILRPVFVLSEPVPLHAHELLAAGFFLLYGCVAMAAVPMKATLLLGAPAAIWVLCAMESRNSRRWTRVTREWASLGLILVAYWSLQFLAGARRTPWQDDLVAWDRGMLHVAGLKAAIETAGPMIPGILETAYLLLYAAPAFSLGALYLTGHRAETRHFLKVLFLGTLVAYALLPVVPLASPRLAYPGEDLPSHHGLARAVNVWLLDRMDISTSVFPSGHVAVAFSCAYGLRAAAPARRALWIGAFCFGLVVYLATVYGRYHYAADGLASIVLTTLAGLTAQRSRGRDA